MEHGAPHNPQTGGRLQRVRPIGPLPGGLEAAFTEVPPRSIVFAKFECPTVRVTLGAPSLLPPPNLCPSPDRSQPKYRLHHRRTASTGLHPHLRARFLRFYGRTSGTEAVMATPSVRDIAAFSDAQLAQFMQNHRRHDGDFELPVDGWDKLPLHARNQLAERLK